MNSKQLKFINRHQLVSVMNAAKWQRLAESMTSNPEFEPEVRIKHLSEDQLYGFSLIDWKQINRAYASSIEWLELNPIKYEQIGLLVAPKKTDFSDFLNIQLQALKVPYSIEANMYRVWGYFYSGKQPNFM